MREYSEVANWLAELVTTTQGKVAMSDTASQALASIVPPARRLVRVSPVALLKNIKNSVELDGFHASHVRDAAALIQYLAWLETEVDSGVTEISGADRLELFRTEQEHFVGLRQPATAMTLCIRYIKQRGFTVKIIDVIVRPLSFPTISSAGPHGAVIHYRPTVETDRRVSREELYLVDSGAQYKDGTTDVTRTVHLGTPTQYERECFTRVLQGHIALATAVFPNKTKGHCLDSFARQFLWQVRC